MRRAELVVGDGTVEAEFAVAAICDAPALVLVALYARLVSSLPADGSEASADARAATVSSCAVVGHAAVSDRSEFESVQRPQD